MKSLQVHSVRFFEPKPQSIRCISYDKLKKLLAVSRSDSSIEIWNVQEYPFLERIIVGSDSISIEGLCWCNGRLFSAGLHGYLVEYDLLNLLPQYQLSVTSGSPVWCLSSDERQKYIATGSEDGRVALFSLSSEGVDFENKFDKQEGSILCLAWHKNGDIIVTGSKEAIRVWDVKTGHAITRIILGRISKNEPTVVWSIAVTREMVIISGDSSGKTSFWDGHTGTLKNSFGSRKEDILAVCLNEEEDMVYSSGVDPTITSFMRTEKKWMKSIKRVVHTHDVRALGQTHTFLVSGGDDCNLVFTKYPPKTTVTFFPFCEKPYTSLSTGASSILLQYPDKIEIWMLPDAISGFRTETETNDRNICKNTSPINVARIKPKEEERIVCSSVSSDGKWISYSTQHCVRLFSIKLDSDSPSLTKISLPEEISTFAKNMLFTCSSNRLILLGSDRISVVQCDSPMSVLNSCIKEQKDHMGEKIVSFDQIRLLDINCDDTLLACGCTDGNVFIYKLDSLQIHYTLPRYSCPCTALKFDLSSEHLVVAYSDRNVVEYSLSGRKYTSFTSRFDYLKNCSFHPILSICFIGTSIYLQDEKVLYIFKRTEEKLHFSRKRMKSSEDTSVFVRDDTYRTVTKYENMSSIHSLKESLVVVQNSSSYVRSCLPPPVWRKKFGT